MKSHKMWVKAGSLGTRLYTQLLVTTSSRGMRCSVLHQSSTDTQLLLKQEKGAIGTRRNYSASEDTLEKRERNSRLSFLPGGCLNLEKLNPEIGNSAFKTWQSRK